MLRNETINVIFWIMNAWPSNLLVCNDAGALNLYILIALSIYIEFLNILQYLVKPVSEWCLLKINVNVSGKCRCLKVIHGFFLLNSENCVLQDKFRKYESTLQRKEIEYGVKY